MSLTGAQVKQALASIGAARGTKVDTFDNIASHLNDVMRDIGLTTVQGCATFLANVTQETAFFRTFTEFGQERKRYDPYRGRGLIQTTFEANYREIGRFLVRRGVITDPEKFVKDPAALASSQFAWHTATEYYTRRRSGRAWIVNGRQFASLAELSNANASVDVIAKAINRGNPSSAKAAFGIEERRAMFDAYQAMGTAIVPSARAPQLMRTLMSPASAIRPKFDDGFVGPGTWDRFMAITRTTDHVEALKVLQRELRARGFTGLDGRAIIDDGEGLLDNTQEPTKGTHTQWALAKALGTTASNGIFGSPSGIVILWQRQLQAGRILPSKVAALVAPAPKVRAVESPKQTHGETPLSSLQASWDGWKFPGPGADVSLLEAFSRLVDVKLKERYGAFCLEDNVREKEDWHDNHLPAKTSAHQGIQKIWFVTTFGDRGLAMGADWNASKKEPEFMALAAELAVECGLRGNIEGNHLHVDTWSQRIRGWAVPAKIGRPTNGLLEVDGNWGPETTARLRFVLGMTPSTTFDSDVVRALQVRLNTTTHIDLRLTGEFDEATEFALGQRLGTKTRADDRWYVATLQQSLNLQRI